MSSNLTESSEVKNDNLTISITRKPGSQVVLDIFVSPKATQAAYAKAVKQINKEVSLPGFRKGKAPEDYILRNFSKQVDSAWRDLLLQTAFNESLSMLPNMTPYRRDGVKCTGIKEVSRENGAKFTVEYEIAPNVPKIDLNPITLKHVERKPVTQEQIDNVLQDWKIRLSQWEDITDRPAQEDDYVDLDIDKLEEPVEEICREARFHIKDMGEWMRRAVIGLNVGGNVQAVSEPEEELSPEAIAQFQPTRCSITVKAIKQPKQPELNDEFAQRFGMKSIQDFQERIVADLNNKADKEVTEQLERQLDEALLETYQFDVPNSLLEAEKEFRLKETKSWLEKNATSQESYEEQLSDYERNLPDQVERSCRLFFILMELAEEHKINVTREEVAQELSMQILSGQRPRQEAESKEVFNHLSRVVLLRKVREYAIGHVKRL